jgi:hypothetical protein
LQGATNVLVEGISYNVSFEDGFCISLFSGCDEAADFTFQTATDAASASAALLTQVFDGGPFEHDPSAIRGVESTVEGYVFTPWGRGEVGAGVPGALFDGIHVMGPGGGLNGYYICPGPVCVVLDSADLMDYAASTWAVWTPASAVPIPAAVWLFGTALIGFVGVARKRKVG